MEKILLSIGIIFKNDIRCIERCLKSLEPLRKAVPCQLVMADTGSTDGSRAVAARYADLLIDFPWVNDFAAARNAVMDRCTGAWYLSIDTDEFLEDSTELVSFLRSKKKNPAVACGLVIQRNYASLTMDGDYMDGLAGRVLRMDTGLRFKGAIHEVWPVREHGYGTTVFYHTILKHDGYVYASLEDCEAKARRNLDLLEPLLAQNPEDGHRLLQCMESAAGIPELRMQYARLGMEFIEKELPQAADWGGVICRQAVENANRSGAVADRDRWMEEGLRRFPQNPFVQIDLNYYRMAVSHERKDFAQALSSAEAYRQALGRYDRKEYPTVSLMLSPMYMTAISCRMWGAIFRADCLCRLERWTEAGEALMELAPEQMTTEQITTWVNSLRRLYEAGYEVTEQVKKLEPLLSGDFSENEKSLKLQKTVQNLAASYFFVNNVEEPGKRLPYGMFGTLSNTDLGRAVQLIDTGDGEEARQIAASVKCWTSVPVPAMARMVAMNQPFPDSFYQLGREKLQAIAGGMANTRENIPRLILLWMQCDQFQESMVKFQFLFDLTTAALRKENWKSGEEREQLCGQFLNLAADYLPNYYNSALLQDETEWSALPNLHHFAWILLQAREAENNGDTTGYVRALQKALQISPAMKDMVGFLLEHKPQIAAQRQLEELAEQVRAILDQYAPDDPAVTALKQSEAYQKVAPLLEQQKPSGAGPRTAAEDHTPVSPAPLEQALAGSREEIAASIRQNLGRWGEVYAKARTNYWEKYALWGKDEHEVVDNLSTALSTHGANFRWLFDRLEDEQSRRILTAVVRSWRFFEIEPLKAVKDRQYDDYFDLSLLHCDEHEVVADLGAYTGDTFRSYVKNYGSMAYRRYYAYEITRESFGALEKATASYPRVVLRRKGAGAGPGTMTLDAGADASSNTLSEGKSGSAEMVEIVALDDDITEPLTFIKMDIEGAEQSALRGCARHIREERPKLALSVYHNFEDLWKLPRIVEELAPGYRFYLRYHGDDLWPSEITLLGIPD